ncbi:hypothetical protein Nepgr_020362 [Nepenthes gracilis]|uniref:Uncharacterized protein n=1 Tax=Nepenthes gracilis TaxID=150966 RepID=A0AAD3SX64_NEPGR|nr:hypothetical protein Nepgr_020362 [Nepenthes gracilis]
MLDSDVAPNAGLAGPVPNESPQSEVHEELGCQLILSPIDEFGNSGQFPCSVAEEVLPQPESLPSTIVVLNVEPLYGHEFETPALPSTDPNSPLLGPVPLAIMDLGDTRQDVGEGLCIFLDELNYPAAWCAGAIAGMAAESFLWPAFVGGLAIGAVGPLSLFLFCVAVSASGDGESDAFPEVFAGAEVASPAGAVGLVDVECISGNSAAG